MIDSLTAGGAEALVAPFARAFAARGGELRVCCLKSIAGNPYEAELRAAGIPVTNLGARNLRDVGAFRSLLRLLREERVGLVHAHLTYASLWGALACRIAGLPCVATLHVVPSGASRRSREGMREALMVRALDRWAARVIAVSGAVRDAWIARGGIDPAKLAVIGNGIEIEAFAGRGKRDAVRRELGIEAGEPLAVTVSVLREGKGIEELLDAIPAVLAAHPAARFLIAGDGPQKEALAARAAGLGLGDRVVWAGFRRDVPALLAAGDLFVLPSLWDAYPTVLLEALAAGRPVVSTRAGGIPEIVDDPRTGRLVPPGDAETLAGAISGLLGSPEERKAMGRAAREAAAGRFSVGGWVERLQGIYWECGGMPFEASPPVPLSLTGEGGRNIAGLANRRPPFSAKPFADVPPRPSGRGGQGVRLRRARRSSDDNPLDRPLRLTLVEPAGRGGMIHYAYQLCRALAAAGAEVTLVTSRHYELDALPHPFRLHKILRLWDPKPAETVSEWTRGLRRLGRAMVHYREWLRLALHLRRERPDLVLLGDIRFPGDLAPLLLLRLFGLRLADICHNVFPYATSGRAAGLFRRTALDRFLYRRIYRRFERVFVHYEANRREFLTVYRLPSERVVAIPHGNEAIFEELRSPAADASALRRSLDLAPDEPVALLFGTLSRYKGTDLLLRAFARVAPRAPRARLIVAGFPAADFDLPAHQDLARELGIADHVRWAPRYIDSGEVAAWMELASVAVFPYRAIYQSGALAVAQTFGVPIIATTVGALPEAIRNGETGILVPLEDPDALAAALLKVLEDPDLARRLGERARQDARERLGWARIARTLLDACRPLLAAQVTVGAEMEARR